MIELIKTVDKTLGWLLCQVFRRKQRPIVESPESVAFIQLWGLGESLLTLPAIKQYSDKHPGTKVTVVCTKRVIDVYRRHDFIGLNVLACPLNPVKIVSFIMKHFKEFGVVYDFEEYLNVSALIARFLGRQSVGFEHGARAHTYNKRVVYNDRRYVAKVFCDLVGEEFKEFVKLPINHEETDRVDSFYEENGLNDDLCDVVLLFPGTAESAPWRAWPKERWYDLQHQLDLQGRAPVFVLGPMERSEDFNNCLVFKGNVWELAALIERAGTFISSDTGPMHLAYIHGAKTVCLFGPNIPERWFFRSKHTMLLHHLVDCCPCIDSRTGKMNKCSKDSECMRSITVKEVLACLT